MSVWAVVLAAGSGERFGAPKQFARLGGRRLYEWAVDAVAPVCDGVVLVLPAGRDDAATAAAVVSGGATRSQSVRAGLASLPASLDVVVVHDAAHPLAGSQLVRELVATVASDADAAVPVLAVTETIATVTAGGIATTTPAEGQLLLLQAPAAFDAAALRAVHAGDPEADADVTLLLAAGHRVVGVAGPPSNVCVTTAAELELAGHLLAQRHAAGS
jgi:2-C-methyl-D-erythritol 4-phosphate cytidylyltransferase